MIRSAVERDLSGLREIELAAGRPFRDLGMLAVADDEPPSVAELAVFQEDGRAWVASDDADRPVGSLLVAVVDGNAHVEQVSVHPRHAGQGLGRELVERAASWAREQGLTALTLTCFADVPWNGPYDERLGFRAAADDGMTGAAAHSTAGGRQGSGRLAACLHATADGTVIPRAAALPAAQSRR